ncbi:MAG: NAD(P)H-hydrate dehydratase [Candidatus Omnitrophica bacterium]|nr:NAD(P)H-hydrate dehydratase [Candidatus Omnitrophota bacterium]
MKEHIQNIKKRGLDTHKGDFGHVFVVAGSVGMTGAAYLTSQTALLCGSGLVTLGIPESLNDIMEIKLTEVMTLPLEQTVSRTLSLKAEKRIMDFSEKVNVCALGPGLSTNKKTLTLIRKIVPKLKVPLVLDADGLNAISTNVGLLKKRKAATVITPHLGEMARLTGKSVKRIENFKENVAKEFAMKYNVVVVLKGYNTVIADTNGQTFINTTGNSGMSTAGTGDVLTGIIASLIGQGIHPYSAAVLGVYMHGKAGDLVAKEKGQFSLIATDILKALPRIFKDIV